MTVKTSSRLELRGMKDELTEHIQEHPAAFSHITEAGNGKIVNANTQGKLCPHRRTSSISVNTHGRSTKSITANKIRQYDSWADFPLKSSQTWEAGDVKQVVSGLTSFTALCTNGDVWTWGDERYSACLGRESSKQETGSSRYISPFPARHTPQISLRRAKER
jgi:hypothetical protein